MSQCESPVGPPLEFVAEPDQLREVPDELDDGPEGARADLGLAGRHAAKVHQADAGGRASPVRPRQAVHQDGVGEDPLLAVVRQARPANLGKLARVGLEKRNVLRNIP